MVGNHLGLTCTDFILTINSQRNAQKRGTDTHTHTPASAYKINKMQWSSGCILNVILCPYYNDHIRMKCESQRERERKREMTKCGNKHFAGHNMLCAHNCFLPFHIRSNDGRRIYVCYAFIPTITLCVCVFSLSDFQHEITTGIGIYSKLEYSDSQTYQCVMVTCSPIQMPRPEHKWQFSFIRFSVCYSSIWAFRNVSLLHGNL